MVLNSAQSCVISAMIAFFTAGPGAFINNCGGATPGKNKIQRINLLNDWCQPVTKKRDTHPHQVSIKRGFRRLRHGI
jgi:hypothetical protein